MVYNDTPPYVHRVLEDRFNTEQKQKLLKPGNQCHAGVGIHQPSFWI